MYDVITGVADSSNLSSVVQTARKIYAAIAKVSPELKKFDFENADFLAREISISDEQIFLHTPEYQSLRQDFEDLAKIQNLLKDFNFRTAKIDFDLREVGCGGFAYQDMYQEMRAKALSAAKPALKAAIRSADYEKAQKIATELIKTSDFSAESTYGKLVELLQPEKHFLIDEDSNCYYAPLGVTLESEDLESSEDAFAALPSIAESEDNLSKFLAVIWLLDVQSFECLDAFSEYDFLKSAWFAELLESSVNFPDTDVHQIIKSLLVSRMPQLARRIFGLAKHPELSEEDYYQLVAAAASEISAEEPEHPETADESKDTEEEYYDDLI